MFSLESDSDFTFIQFVALIQCIYKCPGMILYSILQALVRGELDILKDWCYEAVGSNDLLM